MLPGKELKSCAAAKRTKRRAVWVLLKTKTKYVISVFIETCAYFANALCRQNALESNLKSAALRASDIVIIN